jgi:hypothetical protein
MSAKFNSKEHDDDDIEWPIWNIKSNNSLVINGLCVDQILSKIHTQLNILKNKKPTVQVQEVPIQKEIEYPKEIESKFTPPEVIEAEKKHRAASSIQTERIVIIEGAVKQLSDKFEELRIIKNERIKSLEHSVAQSIVNANEESNSIKELGIKHIKSTDGDDRIKDLERQVGSLRDQILYLEEQLVLDGRLEEFEVKLKEKELINKCNEEKIAKLEESVNSLLKISQKQTADIDENQKNYKFDLKLQDVMLENFKNNLLKTMNDLEISFEANLETRIQPILEKVQQNIMGELFEIKSQSDVFYQDIKNLNEKNSVNEHRVKSMEGNTNEIMKIVEHTKQTSLTLAAFVNGELRNKLNNLDNYKADKSEVEKKADLDLVLGKVDIIEIERMEELTEDLRRLIGYNKKEFQDLFTLAERNNDRRGDIISQWVLKAVRKDLQGGNEEGGNIAKMRCLVCDQVVKQKTETDIVHTRENKLNNTMGSMVNTNALHEQKKIRSKNISPPRSGIVVGAGGVGVNSSPPRRKEDSSPPTRKPHTGEDYQHNEVFDDEIDENIKHRKGRKSADRYRKESQQSQFPSMNLQGGPLDAFDKNVQSTHGLPPQNPKLFQNPPNAISKSAEYFKDLQEKFGSGSIKSNLLNNVRPNSAPMRGKSLSSGPNKNDFR